MTKIYSACWVLPVSSPPIEQGAVAIDGAVIVGVGGAAEIVARFPEAPIENFGEAVILPGLVNTHTHLELTALRGYLENEERDFLAWLRKLTLARLERMTPDDLLVSATWGACEAVRAGITCVGDASDSGLTSMAALQQVGLRGVVFQESFGPDPRLVGENVEKLKSKIQALRESEDELVRAGVSPHAPYTVCRPQLELIAEFALQERLRVMMHAGESEAEESCQRDGTGLFSDGLAKRGIEWRAPGLSSIQYLKQSGILDTQPLLAHCIRVDHAVIETLKDASAKVAHCPKSNAKLGHGRAPFAQFIAEGIAVGLGSDSVASNNTCDLIEEARFASLISQNPRVNAAEMLRVMTTGGARCLGFEDGIGKLRENYQADLAIVSLSGPHQIPVYDPVTSLIFSSSGRDVLLTTIAGREVYRDRRITTVDEERLRARMNEIAAKLN
jgi:5-methylthioadenosine/S-adenosylhomocysteine deaminase